MNERERERERERRSSEAVGGRYPHRIWTACARGFQVRSVRLVVFGLAVVLAAGYLYFSQQPSDDVERGFPSYMQNVDR